MKKKILKILISICIICICLTYVIKEYGIKEKSVEQKFIVMAETPTTIKQSIIIKTYAIQAHFEYISAGKYEEAYEMFTEEYKAYKKYDDFVTDSKNIKTDTMYVKEVKQMNDSTYMAITGYETVEGKAIETKYLIFANEYNDLIYSISPNNFMYYFGTSKIHSENGIKITVEKYLVETTQITVNLKVKNTNRFKGKNLMGIDALLISGGRIRGEDINRVLKPNEEIELSLTYESNYYFPTGIRIKTETIEGENQVLTEIDI